MKKGRRQQEERRETCCCDFDTTVANYCVEMTSPFSAGRFFIIVALVSVVRYISRCFRALYNFLFSGSCGAADTLTHCPVLPMNTHTPAFPSHTCPSYTFCIAGEQQKPELLALCRERSLKLAVCFKQNLKIVFHARWRGFVTKEILTISDTTIPPCSLISGHHYR